MAMASGDVDPAWTTLTRAHALPEPKAGQRTHLAAPGAAPVVSSTPIPVAPPLVGPRVACQGLFDQPFTLSNASTWSSAPEPDD